MIPLKIGSVHNLLIVIYSGTDSTIITALQIVGENLYILYCNSYSMQWIFWKFCHYL